MKKRKLNIRQQERRRQSIKIRKELRENGKIECIELLIEMIKHLKHVQSTNTTQHWN